MEKAKVTFNSEKLRVATELMRAVAHPLRLKILEFIDSQEIINVNAIYKTLDLEQSITSQHLRILKLANVVHAEREGKFIKYRINYPIIMKVEHAMHNYLNWNNRKETVRSL